MKQWIMPVLAIFLCMGSYAQAPKMKDEKASGKKMKTKPDNMQMKGDMDHMKMKDGMAMQAVDLPYTVTYSSQFTMGNPKHAKLVLDMYKAYENNDFSGENRFSDTATFALADGNLLQGAEAISSALAQGRNSQSKPTFTISAIMPVHSVDKNADWVLVWGTQSFNASGTNESTDFHSIWMINKDGKVDFVQVFEGKPTGR